MRKIVFIAALLTLVLSTATWAVEIPQTHPMNLDPVIYTTYGEPTPRENSTLKQLLTMHSDSGDGGAGTCTIIPWFCDPD